MEGMFLGNGMGIPEYYSLLGRKNPSLLILF
jgi:hypothetical protein